MKHFSKKSRFELEVTILSLVKNVNDIPSLASKYNLEYPMRELKKHGIDNANYFSDDVHRKIFKIYLKMESQSIPINIDSFQDFLNYNINLPFPDKKIIFEKFLLMRTADSAPYVYFEYYCHLFKEHLIMDYWDHIFKMYSEESFPDTDLIRNSFGITDGFNELWKKFTQKQQENTSDIKEELRQKVKNKREGRTTSVTFDLPEWDKFTGGFENSELTLLAGRPSMGKTTVAIAFIKRAIKKNRKVHFFTLEMTRQQLMNRFVADDLDIDYEDIKRGNLTDEQLDQIIDRYSFYDSHPYLIIEDLLSQSLSLFYEKIKQVESDLIVVDYLQLFTLDGEIKKKVSGNREQEVGEISKALKRYAKEVNRPILALSQLSRAVETRPNKRPQLSDLRESGSLEQDADVIVFVFRKAYYEIQAGAKNLSVSIQGNIELIIAKGREIGLRDFEMWLDLKKSNIFEGFRY